MIGIYKITNQINGKCYIGRSVYIEGRWTKHKNTSVNKNDKGYNYPLYKAIRKYGIDNFKFEVLELCAIEQLQDKERFFISLYQSNHPDKGYNQTEGGDDSTANRKFSETEVSELTSRLQSTKDRIIDVAQDYGVTEATIINFNKGLTYHKDNVDYPIRKQEIVEKSIFTCPKCGAIVTVEGVLCRSCCMISKRVVERPSPLQLAEQIVNSNFSAVARMFGVSSKSIEKWCQVYGIPHTYEKLKQWYCEQTGQTYELPTKKNPKEKVVRILQQLDLETGEVVNEFDSMASAKKHLDIKNNHIAAVCSGKRKSASGYGWRYV